MSSRIGPHRALPVFALAKFAALASLAALGATPGATSFAAEQDLLRVAPEYAHVEYKDARVRVVRLRIPEHAVLPQHDRPNRVVVSLTANHVQLTRPDGTTSVTRTEAGSVAWSGPAVRSVTNLGAKVENIVVELKQATAPALPVAGPPAAPGAQYLDDPWHKWLFENQYIRVYDVRIPPGVSTHFHRHACDQVVIYVSGGLVSTQVEGKAWTPPTTVMPRSVEYAADAATPVTHRVRNDGDAEYHVVVVQFLQ